MWKINPLVAALGLTSLLIGVPIHAAEEEAVTAEAAATEAPAVQVSPAEVAPPAELPDPVALVNGTAISKTLYESYAQQRQAQAQGQLGDINTLEVRRVLADELVVQELLLQEAQKQKLDQDAQLTTQLELIRRNLLATAAVRKLLEQQAPDEAIVKAEYEKAIAGLTNTEYKARHILVDSEDKAKALIEEIKGGADFAELAKTHSSDSSGANGGDLGWFGSNMMVKPFADAVAKLEKGASTQEPVQSQFGWHVIMLDDTRAAAPPSLEELRPQISQMLQGQTINNYLSKLRQDAQVDVKIQ